MSKSMHPAVQYILTLNRYGYIVHTCPSYRSMNYNPLFIDFGFMMLFCIENMDVVGIVVPMEENKPEPVKQIIKKEVGKSFFYDGC